MPRKVAVIHGHPRSDSLCSALAATYVQQAIAAGHEVRQIDLATLDFDPVLHGGYQAEQALEAGLPQAQADLVWAEHLVFAYPVWWGGMPAVLKGFIDRTFQPGVAFRYRKDSPWWDKLFAGKTARLLVTADSPRWWTVLVNGDTAVKQLKGPILGFWGCPRPASFFSPVRTSTPAQRQDWLDQVSRLAQEAA